MPDHPNIVLIVVHDLGRHLGCYGYADACSPNLDAFAEQGVRFDNHFATAAFCSPCRGSIITGKWPSSNGLLGLVNLGWDLPRRNTTLAQLLGRAGYDTLLFGVQHEVKDVAQLGFGRVPECPSRRGSDVAPVVVDFLRERGREASSRPFYARVGFSDVHRLRDGYQHYAEWAPDPASISLPPYIEDTPGARQDLAQFYGCIEQMDAAVGLIFAALDESGLADNTLVVFMNDHGIDFPRAKGMLYDPGIRNTLLLRWPAGVQGGQTAAALTSHIDLLPTLLEAAGAPVPDDVEGRSFLPMLQGRAYEPNVAVFAEANTHAEDTKRCVRTARWKFIRNYDEGPAILLTTGMMSSLTGRDMGDAYLAPRPAVELYDLEADPNEFDNLASRPEYAEVERDMAHRLDRWMQQTGDPLLRGPVPRPPDEAEILAKARAQSARDARGR